MLTEPRRIRFFDTTLRDGEQMPGVHLSRVHKVEIARQLERLQVDMIEAGFPASSAGDKKAVEAVAAALRSSGTAALARCSRSDIDAAWEAVKGAVHPRIHVFIATSDIHIEYKLKSNREAVLEKISDSVSYARSLCEDIEFSAEDAGRTDVDYLLAAVETAVRAGATTINIPDTVGYTMPADYGRLIHRIREHMDALTESCQTPPLILSVHCHNDLGCATANSLAAIENGAEQVECTINGLGERAGNAALEEIVMALRIRSDYYGVTCGIETSQLIRTSRLISSLTGIAVPPNKAVVGDNAFAHESGIHQHGVLADRRTYEIMTPEMIGLSKDNLVLGKLSGRHAFSQRVAELGYNLDPKGIDICFQRFKTLADKKTVCDEDIMAIVNEYLDSLESIYTLDTFQIQSGNQQRAMAMISLNCGGTSIAEAALGDGPVNAAFNAINRLSGVDEIVLEEYTIKAVTEGADALGEAKVKISIYGVSYSGRSASTDIIKASIKAYVNALNKWAKVSGLGAGESR